MNERLHHFLDGDLPRSAATPEEQQDLAEAETLISAVLRSIPAQPLPDLAPSILQRIEALSPAPARPAAARFHWQRLRDWLWTPRPVSFAFRPAHGFAFGLMLLLASTVVMSRAPEPAAAPQVFVQFRLDAPQASRVALAGNFTNWQPKLQMTRSAGGVWTIVVPLHEGVHSYAFVVDGNVWQPDPLARSVSDGFGGQNSQISILSPDVAGEES